MMYEAIRCYTSLTYFDIDNDIMILRRYRSSLVKMFAFFVDEKRNAVSDIKG